MKILYGIQLNGNGHITRSIEIISSLKERGFEIDVITSGENSNLNLPFEVKKHFKGFSIFYNRSGSINWLKSIFKSNIFRLLKDIKFDVTKYDLVISDFEPISAWSAKRCSIKSIGISNQCSLISTNTSRKGGFSKLFKLFIKYFAKCDNNIGISYEKSSDSIYQPIISNFFLKNKVSDDGFFLVYLPSISLNFLINEMSCYRNLKFKIYSDEVKFELSYSNIMVYPINKESFQKDLLRCSGIITASGFSTTSEALVLNKKLWSIPLKGQYEQLSNADSLSRMGVFTSDFNSNTLGKWILSYSNINYSWVNPKDDIINKIISIYEN
jgi:uncharacterized protein (TIGR00661 family)